MKTCRFVPTLAPAMVRTEQELQQTRADAHSFFLDQHYLTCTYDNSLLARFKMKQLTINLLTHPVTIQMLLRYISIYRALPSPFFGNQSSTLFVSHPKNSILVFEQIKLNKITAFVTFLKISKILLGFQEFKLCKCDFSKKKRILSFYIIYTSTRGGTALVP